MLAGGLSSAKTSTATAMGFNGVHMLAGALSDGDPAPVSGEPSKLDEGYIKGYTWGAGYTITCLSFPTDVYTDADGSRGHFYLFYNKPTDTFSFYDPHPVFTPVELFVHGTDIQVSKAGANDWTLDISFTDGAGKEHSLVLHIVGEFIAKETTGFPIPLFGATGYYANPPAPPGPPAPGGPSEGDIPPNMIKIHFGPGNDKAEEYYYIEKQDCTAKGLGIDTLDVQTQDKAQSALVDLDGAIVKKDEARAYFGTMQNRLENTASNLRIQAENLQAAELRISDVDVALEMTEFVRNQILTQAAVAMLAQANTMPHMMMQLLE
jgi:hypothetical protein